MDDDNKKQRKASVLMFPWLSYGHITPYLELAKKLSTRGFYIYLCSTRETLKCIDENSIEKFSDSIELIPLFLKVSPALPPEYHTTNGLPPHLMLNLKKSLDKSVESFALILENLQPDLLIYDFLQPWAALLAEKLNIPSVLFFTCSSAMISFVYHHFKNPNTEFPNENIKFHDYESSFQNKLFECAKNQDERERNSVGVERSSKIVLINGFREIEDEFIYYASLLVGKRFVPVGALVQEPSCYGSLDILLWLERKERKSTVFVSFGSEYFPSKEDMDEIAHGLELSNVNFIWVVRFPKGKSGSDSVEKTLPKGFLDRVGDRGRVVEGWAPQVRILGHENTGGFVSHCGWNSVLESMKCGVPIIAVPMHMDQPINARLVVEVGVGVEVLRDEQARLHREALAAVIERVVVEEGGASVRRKAADMKEKQPVFPDWFFIVFLSRMWRFFTPAYFCVEEGDEEIDQVVQELWELCSKSISTN